RAEMFEDVQQPGGDMMEEFYPEGGKGDLHKVQLWFEFDDAAATFTSTGATLQNVTTTGGQKELAFYRWTWAKRAVQGSASNYTNLFALVDMVNFNGLGEAYRRQLETTVDVDNWLKTYAVEHIVGNGDSFAYGGGQNMYCCKPVDDTWKMLIWDIDFAFSAQPATSDVFQGIGRSNGIDLSEPGYLRRYWQILQDLANGPLTGTKLYPLLDAKYNAMVANLRTVENPLAIKTFVSQRRSYLLSLIGTNVPATFILTLNNGAGFSTNRNLLALTGTAPLGVRIITINGVAVPVTWTSVSNWTAQLALSAGANTLAVRGWDAASNAVVGASATLSITYTGPVELAQDKVVLNEIMYHPAVPDASFVELYNTSANNAFDLSGWKLSGADFVFPGGTIIPPNGFLVVAGHKLAFAGAYGATISLVGEFRGTLQNSGETLRLIQPGATPPQDVVVDEVRYEARAPWPAAADGTGASLQLIDPSQDNNRVANWAAVASNSPAPGPGWRYVVAPGIASSSAIYLYLQSAGEAYIDDIQLVAGTVPENGPNLLANGDFESVFPGPWGVSSNLSASAVSTSIKHSGNGSLHVMATSGGTTRSSAIYQDLATGLVLNAPYTLSFWVLESTNGGTLTMRLSGNGISTNVNLLPGSGDTSLARCTPGAPNSVRASLPLLPKLWLNEILPSNLTGLVDRFGHHHPWVELYNNGPTNLSLAGMFLANSYSNLMQWPFPASATIGAGQFLVVWLDGNAGESVSNELHTSFSIPPTSGALALVNTNGGRTNLLDYLNYALTHPDRSYGACPDGRASQRQAFFYPTPGGTNNPASPPLNVVINEWMADNQAALADPADNHFEDWFELYNPGDTIADLSGFYLGTSLTNKTKFRIPDGYILPAQGYLLVWADSETSQNSSNRTDLHVNFKLSKEGEAIGLFAPDGTVIDFVSFGGQTTDVSEGRFPDGAGYLCVLTRPTPRVANFLAVANTPPVLGALSNCTVFEGQMAVFTATATDADLPAQQLAFSLDPGAPTNASINPATGLFAWRPTSAQTPGTNTITLRVTDDGVPPLSATATFVIRVVPRPRVTSIVPQGSSGCALSFEAVPQKRYRLEFKNALQDSAWQVLVPAVLATADNLTFQDEGSGSPQRFYRIVVLE
ncbi:MAG TPA: lamin tail domain-containing protein, partial [Candidatus Sulfotelmatobacter sp.]|nr:lamin tail domain-containing protein [Candidatus Sulfotelmatobacter sp.]